MNHIAFFPIVTETEDDLGQVDSTESYTHQVFCHKRSAPQSEFFQAGTIGIKAACVLEVYTAEYNDDETVLIEGTVFHIYRTYERPDEKTELYCEVRRGDDN